VAQGCNSWLVSWPCGHQFSQQRSVRRPENNLFLGREVAEERARRHVGRRSNLLDRCGLEPILCEQLEARRLDGPARPILLSVPQRHRGFLLR